MIIRNGDVFNLEWWLTNAPDFYVDYINHSAQIWPYLNSSGSAINAGAPCCLLVASFDGIAAGIPAANNMALFRGCWLGTIINGALSNVPDGSYGLVQHWGMVQDQDGTGAARVLGHADLSAAGKFLKYTAGNDYFERFADLYSDLEEQSSLVLTGESWTTASTALKKTWLKG